MGLDRLTQVEKASRAHAWKVAFVYVRSLVAFVLLVSEGPASCELTVQSVVQGCSTRVQTHQVRAVVCETMSNMKRSECNVYQLMTL